MRRGQHNSEFLALQGPDGLTPDIVAGHIRGHDHSRDFHIDVTQPQGEFLLKPEAGSSKAVAWMEEAIRTGAPMPIHEIGTEHVESAYLKPLNRKMEKYGKERRSPLYGHVSYFDARSPVGALLAHDYVRSANMFLGYESLIGPDGSSRLLAALTTAQHHLTAAVFVRLIKPIAFVGIVARNPSGHTLLLFANRPLFVNRDIGHHPVLAWLRKSVRRSQGAAAARMPTKAQHERAKRRRGEERQAQRRAAVDAGQAVLGLNERRAGARRERAT